MRQLLFKISPQPIEIPQAAIPQISDFQKIVKSHGFSRSRIGKFAFTFGLSARCLSLYLF